MARLFYGFVLAGVVLTFLLAGTWPLPEHPRYRSAISVVPDRGREESFVLRWPGDRITLNSLQPGDASSASSRNPLDTSGPARAEIFRMRDRQGNVIGIASRISHELGADWTLLIPGRGALFLSRDKARGTTAARDGEGSFAGGRGEFELLQGTYEEHWQSNPQDPAQGEITLTTILQTRDRTG